MAKILSLPKGVDNLYPFMLAKKAPTAVNNNFKLI